MRRLFVLVSLFISIVLHGAGMKSAFLWDVTDVGIQRFGDDGLTVDIEFNILNDGIANKSAVVLQPYVLSAGKRTDFTPMSFYRLDSSGNRYRVRKNVAYASGLKSEIQKICGISKGRIPYQSSCLGVMDADSLEVFVEVTEWVASDKKNFTDKRKIASFVPSPCPEFYPDFFPVYVGRDRYGLNTFANISLRVMFDPSKGSVFDIRTGDNEADVYEFVEQVSDIIKSPHSNVNRVSLTYYTSIEGSASENQRIASSKLKSIHAYLKKQNLFGRVNVTTEAIGEDWSTVQDWFARTWWNNDRELSRIMYDPSMPKDVKERRMRENYDFWKSLDENVFDDIERMECYIEYSYIPYDSNEDRWVAYYSGETVLSQYDYSCMLESQQMWSSGWYDIAFDFAQRFPLCREAQIDGLCAALSLGQMNEASKYVRNLGNDDNSKYYKAVWLMYMGDIDGSYKMIESCGENPQYFNTRTQIKAIYDWNHNLSPWDKHIYVVYPRQ